MKKISIKMQVTIWYTIIIVLLVVTMMTILLMISNRHMKITAHIHIKNKVNTIIDKISFNNGELEIKPRFEFYEEGIYLSIYDENARFLYGRVPSSFDNKVGLLEEDLQTVSQDGNIWYLLDRLIPIEGYGDIWIRGITSQSEVTSALNYMINLSLIILPFLILFVILVGYYITKRAFKPITYISETAKQISAGHDLSKRIYLGEGQDEIYQLANTFDDMLNRLQDSFENEKQFTSDASHELRTPISVIIAECEYLLENADTIGEIKESLDIVLKQARRMSGLISQLLTLARTDKGNQKLNPEKINLSELAEIIAEDQKELAMKKMITIHTEIEEHVIIYADETMIMRALINMISNALKYGKKGGYILIGIRKEDDHVIGFVKDDGIGIERENLEKIWNRFYQVDLSRTSMGEKGMGLGLSIVQWIIQAHGGQIFVESIIGQGSTFTFQIPIK